MWTDRVRLLDDVAPADWIAGRLTGPGGTVFGTVPSGYAAYARVLHPADSESGEPVTWARVAEVTGRRVHPAARWHTLIDAAGPYGSCSELWPHGGPEVGNLPLAQLRALCEALSAHTTTPGDCFFALWEGWGHLNGGRSLLTPEGGEPVPPLLSPQEWASPRLRLPGRDYLLLRGPLPAVTDLARYDGPEVWWTQSPSLFWPADRAWCVATEIDFDSTFVGGSTAAIGAVLTAPMLEAWPIARGRSPLSCPGG
ncbi:hypothetical protein [Microbispora sp. NBC_01389]|uniref:hypothetical protein n=1 Tax=Microbispora sp. NBC_01389 TaxID=2903584 RepID=UPI003248D01E